MLSIIFAAAIAHTPKHFIAAPCSQESIELSNIRVSQVTYIQMEPGCNVTFDIKEKCDFNIISLHRFTPTHSSDAFIEIENSNGTVARFLEINNTKEAEPFTTTQYVTTIKLDTGSYNASEVSNSSNSTTASNSSSAIELEAFKNSSCTMTIGAASKTRLSFVVGKSEEWWLFLTLPYYAPRIQWGWAFTDVSHWYWPYLVYVAFVFIALVALAGYVNTSHRYSLLAALLLFACCLSIDYLVPVVMVTRRLDGYWPTGWMWNIVVFFKLFRYAEMLYLYICVESGSKFTSLDYWNRSILGIMPYSPAPQDGPADARTVWAPVSIVSRNYVIDLFIWCLQVSFFTLSLALHIALCMPVLFIVLLFRLQDYNIRAMDAPVLQDSDEGVLIETGEVDEDGNQIPTKKGSSLSFVWAIGYIIQKGIMYMITYSTGYIAVFALRYPLTAQLIRIPSSILMYSIYYVMFPMFFACRLFETLVARTIRLVLFRTTSRGYSQLEAQVVEKKLNFKGV